MDQKLRLSLIFQAAGNATNYLRGVGKEGDRTARAVKAARERVSELQRTTKDVGAYRAMEAALGGTRDKLAAAKAEALRLGQAMDAAENPTRQMTRAFELQTGRVRALERQQDGQVRTLGDLKTKLTAAGVSTDALGAHERRLARDLGQANNALDEQTRKMKVLQDRQASMAAARGRYDKTQAMAGTIMSSGASSMGAGAAILAPLAVVGNDAMTFEDAMLDVKKVVDFETPAQFAAMNRDILTLSENMPLIPEDIAKIVAAAGQAKIARGELLGFAEDAGKMGVAFDTTAEDAGSKMATWRTAFAMTQPQVRALADQINYLGDNGNATALKISDVVTRIGPLGEIAGLAAGQIAALGATIVGMGVNEEIAATGIKNTMLALTKGEAATKAQTEAYGALGLEATKVAKAMQVDAGGTILDVMERIQKLSPDRQASILTQLFGSESVAAIAPMLNQLDTLRDNFKAVGDATVYAGSMDAEFQNRMSGATTAVSTMKNGIKAAAVEIGTMFLPQINALSAGIKGAAKWVRDFAQAHPGAVKVIGMLVAAIGIGLVVFGGLAMAVAAVLGPFALLQLALTQVGLMFGAGGLIGSIGGVAGKVLPFVGRLLLGVGRMALTGGAMLGRGLLLAGRGFLTFGAAAAKAGLMLLANPITWIILAIVAAVALLAGAAYLIIKNWGTIGPWLAAMWGRVKTFTASALQGIGSAILNFSPLGLVIRNWSGITGFIGRVWQGVRAAAAAGIRAVLAVLAGWSPLQAIQTAFAAAFNWLGSLPGRFSRIGSDIVQGLTRGIRGGQGAARAAATEAAGQIEGGARTRLDTHSPSRVFASIGRDVMNGFGVGIAGNLQAPIRTMRTAAAAVVAAGSMAAPALADPSAVRPTFEAGPRLSGGGGARPAAPGPMVVNLTINAAPGMDEERLVELALEKLRSAMQPTGSGAFADDSDSMGEAY